MTFDHLKLLRDVGNDRFRFQVPAQPLECAAFFLATEAIVFFLLGDHSTIAVAFLCRLRLLTKFPLPSFPSRSRT